MFCFGCLLDKFLHLCSMLLHGLHANSSGFSTVDRLFGPMPHHGQVQAVHLVLHCIKVALLSRQALRLFEGGTIRLMVYIPWCRLDKVLTEITEEASGIRTLSLRIKWHPRTCKIQDATHFSHLAWCVLPCFSLYRGASWPNQDPTSRKALLLYRLSLETKT